MPIHEIIWWYLFHIHGVHLSLGKYPVPLFDKHTTARRSLQPPIERHRALAFIKFVGGHGILSLQVIYDTKLTGDT